MIRVYCFYVLTILHLIWTVPLPNSRQVPTLYAILPPPYSNYGAKMDKNFERSREIDVVFPEEDESDVILPRIEGIPPCANGSTFCENYVPYPKQKVKEIVEKHNIYKEFFGVDEPPDEFGTRDDSQDKFVCSAKRFTIFPVIAQNTKKQFKFIVNHKEEGYAQGVQVEICSRENKPCDVVSATKGLITSCQQKYMSRRLLSLDSNGIPKLDSFLLPWACACSCRAEFSTERG